MSIDNPDFKSSSPDIYSLLKENARKNRKRMTEAETVMWERLRQMPRPYSFRRQHVIGDYIVEFACLSKKLVVEVDGEYHYTEEQMILDNIRTDFLNRMGYNVIRFANEQVINNTNDVVAQIEELIYDE